MLKDFVDSAGGGRPHLSAIKCVETAVNSGCPKRKQVGNGKVLVENRINACFIPSLSICLWLGFDIRY